MKKIILFIVILLTVKFSLYAQTSGTLTFSVATTSTGSYSPRHIMAIWIEKSDGTFIKTKLKRGNNYLQYLNTWVAKSGQNTVDAVTSATINSHQTETIIWNATDINGNTVPDGDYKVWIQMAWANTNGASTSVLFTKDTTAVHLTPSNTTNFTSMSLDWAPSPSYITKNNAVNFNFTTIPNPFKESTNICFSVKKQSNIKINVYNTKGELVVNLLNEFKTAGNYNINWNGTNKKNNKVNAGIYYISINDGVKITTQKIIKLS